jgi:hypothetical protein
MCDSLGRCVRPSSKRPHADFDRRQRPKSDCRRALLEPGAVFSNTIIGGTHRASHRTCPACRPLDRSRLTRAVARCALWQGRPCDQPQPARSRRSPRWSRDSPSCAQAQSLRWSGNAGNGRQDDLARTSQSWVRENLGRLRQTVFGPFSRQGKVCLLPGPTNKQRGFFGE